MGLTAVFVVLPIAVVLGLVRVYRQHTWGHCKSKTPLNGKVFLITGSSSGLGKETARELAKRNACVIMACRSMKNAIIAIDDIRSSTASGELIPMHLDLASFESIKKFSSEVIQKFPQIHVLINNAGVYFPLADEQTTEEGFEMNFGVNYLGHFLLTKLLLEKLKESSPSRIVIVSSTLHAKGNIDFDDLNLNKLREKRRKLGYNPGYCNSKLANSYHCRELGKRLQNTGVEVYAAFPGFSFTRLFRYGPFKWWHHILLCPVAFFYLRSALQGAQTILHCATEENLKEYSGQFFKNCKTYVPKKDFDDDIQIKLWEKSEALISKAIKHI